MKPPTMQFIFSYPEKGPVDVYALGVPRDAKLVDLVPPADLARVIDGIKASAERFGPYFTINVITDARQDINGTNNEIEVSLTMDDIGTKIWKNLTRENEGGFIAIALDDEVYSAPRINGEIPYGRTSITGFDLKEAIDVANVLNAGKLPAPARIVEEAIVGPSLGQEAIDSGLSSFMLALLVVLL